MQKILEKLTSFNVSFYKNNNAGVLLSALSKGKWRKISWSTISFIEVGWTLWSSCCIKFGSWESWYAYLNVELQAAGCKESRYWTSTIHLPPTKLIRRRNGLSKFDKLISELYKSQVRSCQLRVFFILPCKNLT